MKSIAFLGAAALFLMVSCKPERKPIQSVAQDTTQQATPNTPPAQEEVVDTAKKGQMVKVTTSYGNIVIKLYDETPKHRDNFIKLVKSNFYNNLLFHRVIRGFMIQGGDPQSKGAAPGQPLGAGDVGYTVPAEFNPKFIHKKGALAAARQGDMVNPQKESSGCQFYIVQGQPLAPADLSNMAASKRISYTPEQVKAYTTIGGTPSLDMDYTVFGEVVSGLEIVDKIAAVQTAPGDRPLKDVKFSITLVEDEKAGDDAKKGDAQAKAPKKIESNSK